MLRIVPHGFIVLILLSSLACKASSKGEIHGINVSPDGKLLAVTFVKDKSFFIYRIPVDTGRASRITQNESGEEGGVTFSPDGKLTAQVLALLPNPVQLTFTRHLPPQERRFISLDPIRHLITTNGTFSRCILTGATCGN
jgi:dipeptidyl aminopeptidase/acylaminoacyl peptidase